MDRRALLVALAILCGVVLWRLLWWWVTLESASDTFGHRQDHQALKHLEHLLVHGL